VAGRTILHSVIQSLERIAFNGDPLQFLLIETSYHPFISLFHMLELVKKDPQLASIRKSTCIYTIRDPRILRVNFHSAEFASALAFEIRRGPPPEQRDFLRIKFKNGTDNFQTYHAFGHQADIPVTEFIYRIEVGSFITIIPALHSSTSAPQNYAITSQKQWAAACSVGYHDPYPYLHIGSKQGASSTAFAACAAILFVGVFALAKYTKRFRAKKQYIHLADDEVSSCFDHENYNYGTTTANVRWSRREFDLY